MTVRGDANIIRFNLVNGAAGAGVGVGGAKQGKHTHGIFNQVGG